MAAAPAVWATAENSRGARLPGGKLNGAIIFCLLDVPGTVSLERIFVKAKRNDADPALGSIGLSKVR
jgi:hypothetical protein